MEPIYAIGKKVDDAIKEALKELSSKLNKDVTLDDVNVEILNEGGLFSKAKVKITLDESFIKVETKPELKPQPKAETIKSAPITPAPSEIKREEKKEEKKTESKKAEPAKEIKPKVKAEEKPKAQEVKETKKEQPKKQDTEKREFEKPIEIKEDKYPAGSFIRKLAAEMGEPKAVITCEETSRELFVKITGENMGKFIGNSGETLSAIQTLANVVSGQNRETNKRVYIDAGNYKGGKNDRLKDIAKRFAEEVLEIGESRKLKPMNPYERRIVHAYVSETFELKTKSVGEEPHRCVVILPKR